MGGPKDMVDDKLYKKSNLTFLNEYKSFKKLLVMKQLEEKVMIDGTLEESFIVKKLIVNYRSTKEKVEINSPKNCNDFSFQIDLSNLINPGAENGDYIDLYLLVEIKQEDYETVDLETVPEEIIEKINFDESGTATFRARLGEFEKTFASGIKPIEIDEHVLTVYLTKNNNYSISLNKPYVKKPEVDVKQIELLKNVVTVEGQFYTKNSLAKKADILLTGRDTNKTIKFPITQFRENQINESYFGLMSYQFSTELNLSIDEVLLNEDVYDVYIQLELTGEDEPVKVRLREPYEITEAFSNRYCAVKKNKNVYVVSPHVTHGKNNLSFYVTELTANAYHFLQAMMNVTKWLQPLRSSKKMWLVGELPYKAQDTGFHFFKYMRKKHPKRQVYYVIDENSPEYKNIKSFGNVIAYKSIKHIWYTLMATRIIGSHHPEYIYPVRMDAFKQLVTGKKVFLQHGVMGTRNSSHYYGADSKHFETDLFIVSSDFEKEMIIRDFGYEPQQVKVTGLSRFDSLFDKKVIVKRQLLIIPTWREWLTKEESFLKSEYFDRYKKLASHPQLHELAETYNFEIVFCLHPNMQKYSKHFVDLDVKIINQGEVDVQYLLKESMMMITDYSSVAFDFSFLNKPVLYYQFDRDKFIGERGSHLNLDEDLPGVIAKTEKKLIKLLEEYAQADFKMKAKYKKRAEKFLTYRDRNANKRIFNVVSEDE